MVKEIYLGASDKAFVEMVIKEKIAMNSFLRVCYTAGLSQEEAKEIIRDEGKKVYEELEKTHTLTW